MYQFLLSNENHKSVKNDFKEIYITFGSCEMVTLMPKLPFSENIFATDVSNTKQSELAIALKSTLIISIIVITKLI